MDRLQAQPIRTGCGVEEVPFLGWKLSSIGGVAPNKEGVREPNGSLVRLNAYEHPLVEPQLKHL